MLLSIFNGDSTWRILRSKEKTHLPAEVEDIISRAIKIAPKSSFL